MYKIIPQRQRLNTGVKRKTADKNYAATKKILKITLK